MTEPKPLTPFDPWKDLTTDAMEWAEAFCALYPDAPDTGTMVGWFANAIEVTRSAERAARHDALREALRRLVDSAVLVPMDREDDDDGPAEVWVVHPDPLDEARAALAAAGGGEAGS